MVSVGGTDITSGGAAVVAAMTAAGLQSLSEMVVSKATSSTSWVGRVFLFFKRDNKGMSLLLLLEGGESGIACVGGV